MDNDLYHNYIWSAPISMNQQRKSSNTSIFAVLIVILLVFVLYLIIPASPGQEKQLWVCFLPIGVILIVAVPLLLMQRNASNPTETYTMNETFVKSGYGRASIITFFDKTKSATVTPSYIELDDGFRTNHIQLPEMNGDKVCAALLSHLPKEAQIRHLSL